MVHFGEFLKTWSLRSNSVTRQVSFNRTKIGGKCQNSNATFWVIFKQCELGISGHFGSRRSLHSSVICRSFHWNFRICWSLRNFDHLRNHSVFGLGRGCGQHIHSGSNVSTRHSATFGNFGRTCGKSCGRSCTVNVAFQCLRSNMFFLR